MNEKNNEKNKKTIDEYILEKLATDKLFADGETRNSINSITALIKHIDKDKFKIEENESYDYERNNPSYFKLTNSQPDGWSNNKYVEIAKVKSCYKSITYTGNYNSLDLQISIGKTFHTEWDHNNWRNDYYNKFEIALKKDGKEIYKKNYNYSEGLNTAMIGYEDPWFLYPLYDLAEALPNGQNFERGQISPNEPLIRRDFDIFLKKDFDTLPFHQYIVKISKEEYKKNRTNTF